MPLLSTKTPVFVDRQYQKSTSVHEIVGSGGQDIKQPGFSVEPFYVEPLFCYGNGYNEKEILNFQNLFFSGSRGSRTPDPLLVRQML